MILLNSNRVVSPLWLLVLVCFLLCGNTSSAYQSGSILNVFSDSTTSNAGNFSFSSTTETDLAGSRLGFGVSEAPVYHAALRHRDGNSANDWDIRIGQGGQIYSIRNQLGELVPPQTFDAPFVDEVFQSISVDTSTRANGGEAAFYHQSGYYRDGNNVTQQTYAPLLASGSSEPNSFSTVSLAVQADTTASPQVPPGLLNYQRTRDLGGGVIEVTHSIYNFGGNTVDFHNLPWGGVRKTVLDNIIVSNPNGGFSEREISSFGLFEDQTVLAEDTGGWAAFTQGTDGSSQGIAYVFGNEDTHLGEDFQNVRSSWRWGDGGGDFLGIPIRDFNVGTFRREIDVNPGDLFESRYFLVLGDVDHIESTIAERGLVQSATYDKIDISQQDSATLSYRVQSDENGNISVLETGIPRFVSVVDAIDTGVEDTFETFAQPVADSKPLFLLEDAEGRQFLSVDPYALSDTPFDQETNYAGFFGFVVPEELIEGNESLYVSLNSLFSSDFYLDTDPNTEFFALRTAATVAAVPEPSAVTALLLLIGFRLTRRTKPKLEGNS